MKIYEIMFGAAMLLLSVAVIVLTLLVKNTGKELSGIITGNDGQMMNANRNDIDTKLNKIITILAAVNGAVVLALNIIIAHTA